MSAKILNYVQWPAENGIIAQCCCDTVSELPAVNAFPSYGLLATTSTCLVIDTDELYQLNSLGVWKKKTNSTSVALDLSGYYTSAETDAAISTALNDEMNNVFDSRYLRIGTGVSVSNGTDFNTLKTPGKYRSTNANNGCRNMPTEVAGRPFIVIVENMYGTARVKQTLWLGQSGVVDRFYWRTMYNDTTFSDWYRVDGTVVATDVPTP